MGNSWLLYNHENKRIHRRSKTMSQYQFKRMVAEAWMAQNADGSQRKRRRRSSTPVAPRPRGRRGRRSSTVAQTTRYDRMDHMPAATCGTYNRQRCALCNALTNTYCVKCEAHLCCFYIRNCFRPFHYRNFEDAGSAQNAVPVDADPDSPQPLDNDPDSPQPLDAEDLQSDESNEELQSDESNE